MQEQRFFAAREVAKVDARPGGYVATGGHGGILGGINHMGRPVLLYVPAYKHTYLSEVNTSRLPETVAAVRAGRHRARKVRRSRSRASGGEILADAIPSVSIVKEGSYFSEEFGDDPALERDLQYLIEHKLALGRLGGFVTEGQVPYGRLPSARGRRRWKRRSIAACRWCASGAATAEGFADRTPIFIAGSNLTATKARLLLMACLMRFGALPPAQNPDRPSAAEKSAIEAAVARYQAVFDTH